MKGASVRATIAIWGASGHARVVADILRLCGEFEIVGFIDDRQPERRGEEFLGLPILGGRESLGPLAARGVRHLVLAFGDGGARLRLTREVRAAGFALARAIHPRAVVASDVTVGEGTVIAAGAVVNPGARIGENVIVNTCASVDHDCDVGDGAHVCPGARLAGTVVVGRAAWVGLGAVVIEGVTIGDGTYVGAGSVVVGDLPPGVLAYGVPARVVRSLSALEGRRT